MKLDSLLIAILIIGFLQLPADVERESKQANNDRIIDHQ